MRFFKEEKTTTETNQEVSVSAESHTKEVTSSGHGDGIFSSSDQSQLSLEAQNEKEIETHPDQVTQDAQLGVQKAEAAALVWSKKAVYATYAWIWVCFFLLALNNSISGTVINRAYADFKAAPQVSTASILYSIIGGVLKLPIAKTLNIWGRAEGLVVWVVIYTIGLIVLAACDGPNSYAAGYVLFYVGYSGIYLVLDVYIADTSGLQNRAFTFAFASTPFICTAFTGPLAGESFLKVATWRWAYGVFAIVMPVAFAPLVVLLKYYQRKAESMGLLKREDSGRTTMQSIVHYIHEFDLIGACLLMAAWVLLLLPFSLQQYGRAQYKSAKFIAMVVVGFVLLFVFAAWEKWFTRKHFVRYELLRQRTVLGACIMSAVSYFSFYCWDLYFYDFCIVVFNLSVSMTGYMTQIYNVGSCFWGVVFGVWIRYTKHFKYTCLCFGLPLLCLGAGLMIHFRGEGGNDINYVIMSQIFIAFGGGTIVIGDDMAVMAAADREGVPMMLSLLGLFSSLGGAIGYAVAAAVYTNIFPQALESRLPADLKGNTTEIYLGGYTAQMEFPVGSATRNAVDYAWGRSQMYGSVAGTAILVLGFPAIAVWKNYRVDRKQNKGTMI
ncbi:siderochrome iron transporter 2 [Aspergillus brasiliensis]|uniref:Siderochrome iron transporter 2 n=1 Tax=Aspergillus brasiliensis TaxID=319629 RepID=A0A9W5YQ18_9EURO|nr:siderochrome iron transporter 2 [Aspergillus brasiliensis]GKZ50112.1 siderochrome iron transporter 2 [Aspergillus brasiliensis]